MMMMMMMVVLMMMMMMMMRCPSSLRFRAKPRHLPYIYITNTHQPIPHSQGHPFHMGPQHQWITTDFTMASVSTW